MRTTVTIDDLVYVAARERAELSGVSIGRVISDLARSGLECEGARIRESADGWPVFETSDKTSVITNESIAGAEENDDNERYRPAFRR